jgi:mRNA interferase YafQ
MREIERTTRFRCDYKRETRGRHGATLEASLLAVLYVLVSDEPLVERYRDNPLSGD